jgi:prevent-host-death family protein
MKKRKPTQVHKPNPGSEASLGGKLEEALEFTNLTEFRNSLLNFIPRLQENEYLRFVITKHGQPVAVVLSYDAYNLLKRVAERVMDEDEAKGPAGWFPEADQEVVDATVIEQPAIFDPADVSTAHDISGPELQKTRHFVQLAIQEYLQAMKKGVKDVKEKEEFTSGELEKG